MNTLIHLCNKDFTYAKPWFIGTWLALVASALLPWVSPAGEAALPFMMIGKLAPALLIFLTTVKLVQGDPLVGTNSFMGTRPVPPTLLLGSKLLMVALFLILPALLVAVLTAVFMWVQLSATDYLLLSIEKTLMFAIAAASALVVSVFTRRVGAMALIAIAVAALGVWLVSSIHSRPVFGRPHLEAWHLQASQSLVAQTAFVVAAIVIAMSWALRRQLWITAAVLVVSSGLLASIHKAWTWNFVDALSKEVALEEIVSGEPALTWLDEPRLVSNRRRENIPYSQLTRPGRVAGLKDGWVGELVKFQSTVRFADGTVWASEGASEFDPFDGLAPEILPQLGIQVPENHPLRSYQKFQDWTLFESEKRRLEKLPNRRASIRGTGVFQIYQPCIFGDMPATSGATVVSGRFRYRLDSVSALENEISIKMSIRGVALRSRGDSTRGSEEVEFLFANPQTGQFTNTRGSGGSSRVSGDWISIHRSVSLDQRLESTSHEETAAFLKSARLYLIGRRHGGTVRLSFEMPDIELNSGP